MKKISVIIPNLNSPRIDQTITALEGQSLDPSYFEVIVVGTDRFGLVRSSEITRFVQSDQPLSPAQARNLGVKHANGEILTFTDADCIPATDWLLIIASRFEESSINVLGGGIRYYSDNYWTIADNLSMFYEYLENSPPGERYLLPSLNLAIRRNAFEQVGGFDERYPRASGEDADLCLRLREMGIILNFDPCAIVLHAPLRHNLVDLLQHGYYQGKYSTKVDERYRVKEGLSGVFRTRVGLVLFSPVLALGVLIRMIKTSQEVSINKNTIPAIYLAKLAWCIGASNHPKW